MHHPGTRHDYNFVPGRSLELKHLSGKCVHYAAYNHSVRAVDSTPRKIYAISKISIEPRNA